MSKGLHTIVCRNCKTRVAKTPNKNCISCSIPSWGYTDDELNKISNPTKRTVTQKFVCINCDHRVVRTPINKCHVCSIPFWGYTEFELDNGLVKDTEVAPESKGQNVRPEIEKMRDYTPYMIFGGVLVFIFGLLFFLPDADSEAFSGHRYSGEYATSVDEVKKAIAFIRTRDGTGTGFLVSDKYVLTAGHVACDNNTFEIIFTKNRNETTQGKLIQCSLIPSRTNFDYFERDFALIEIPPISSIKPLKFGDSDAVTEMDGVFTAGHSFGDINLSMTNGGISRLKFGDESFDLFTHTIASNPGNSGGPIINLETNEVIAILVGGRGPILSNNDLVIPQGENIGVKINTVISALEEYIDQ